MNQVALHSTTYGSGIPIYILHGLFGSADNWQTIGRQLSEYYTVHLVDLRNHGRSPHADQISYDLMAGDLQLLMAKNGDRNIFLIGHSLGGKTAIRLTQLYPDTVLKLIVVDMGIKKYPGNHDHIFSALFAAGVEKKHSRKEVEEILSETIQEVSTVQFLMKNLFWEQPGRLAWRFNLSSLKKHYPQLMEALPEEKINTETLFIRGERSGYLPAEDERKIRDIIPNSTFVTIPDAGHWVHADAPMAVVREILAFFRSN